MLRFDLRTKMTHPCTSGTINNTILALLAELDPSCRGVELPTGSFENRIQLTRKEK